MIQKSHQWSWAALIRLLGLPRKRLLLAGIATAVVLVYTFDNFSNSDISRLYIPTATNKYSSDKTPSTTIPPLKNQNAGSTAQSLAHPIPVLMSSGQTKWNSMLKKQSQTLSAAVKEYKRRYGMAPPDGFDLWFEYAKKEKHVLVDEYDELMIALGPLRKIGPKEVRRRAELLLRHGFHHSLGGLAVGGEDVFTYVEDPEKTKTKSNIKIDEDSEIIPHDGGYRTAGLLEMLEPVTDILKGKIAQWPSFMIPVNELAEARIVGGDDSVWGTDALKNTKKTYTPRDLFHEHERGSRTLANDLVKACGEGSNLAKRGVNTRFEFGIEEVVGAVGGGLDGEGRNPDFVVDPNVDNDMCVRPELMTVSLSSQME